MMYARSSGNRAGGIASASRFLPFFLLRWIWGGLNSCSLPIECPTACGGLRNPIKFPFGANSLCGAPGFILDCSNASASGFPNWIPLEVDPVTSLHRNFSVLEIQTTNLSEGSAVISPTAFPLPSVCFNGDSPSNFNLSSAIENLTRPGKNWNISPNTSFMFIGCSVHPQNKNQSPLPLQPISCPSSYNISKCSNSQQKLCFSTKDRVLIQSLDENCDCRYFTSFLQKDLKTFDQPDHPVLAIEWIVDQNLVTQCTSCENSSQSCVFSNSSTEPIKVICAKCEGDICEESSSLAPAPDLAPASPPGERNKTHFLIAFGVAGGSLGFLLLLLLFVVWARRRKWKIQVSHVRLRRSFHKIISSSSIMTNSSGSKSKLLQALEEQVGPIPTTIYSYKELQHATGAFSDTKLLGDGGFGSVYEGILYNGQKVAVKRLYHNSYRRLEQFVNEIRILSCLDHPNLIKLYGFCYHEEPKDLLLVYEFAPHGTLADQLHGGVQHQATRLAWQTRLQIALETAIALEYLHFLVEPPIFHRDVKSANILLDVNFHAKLADFGLSRLVPPLASHVSTAPQGTPGYVDPEYHQCYQLTDKSDVYSFGVVLMEIVSGKVAVDMNRDRREINLSHLALSMIQKGAVEELIDPHLHIDRFPVVKDMARGVAELAFQCLAADKDDRPTMKDVVAELRRIERMGPWSTCPSIPGEKQLLWRNNSLEETGVGKNQQQKHPSKVGEPTLLSPTSVQSQPWNSSESPPDSM